MESRFEGVMVGLHVVTKSNWCSCRVGTRVKVSIETARGS